MGVVLPCSSGTTSSISGRSRRYQPQQCRTFIHSIAICAFLPVSPQCLINERNDTSSSRSVVFPNECALIFKCKSLQLGFKIYWYMESGIMLSRKDAKCFGGHGSCCALLLPQSTCGGRRQLPPESFLLFGTATSLCMLFISTLNTWQQIFLLSKWEEITWIVTVRQIVQVALDS